MRKKGFLGLIMILAPMLLSAYNYLGQYDSNGKPLYLVDDSEITANDMQLINAALPEGYPVPTYNPQYITSGYATDILLDDSAEVWVTFVSEGAGYRSVLGFYTYDLNNPPTQAPPGSQVTIVFPNVSLEGSGGSLQPGNRVKIGSFPAGTGIGWVLLANGWNGSNVTNGLWKLYSNPNFNPETNPALRHHNVLLADSVRQRVYLGFEDIRRDNNSCDNDFNDAIFFITASPNAAMRINNCASIHSATNISSGNNGGLESNGDLATLVAKRNFQRIKFNHKTDLQERQLLASELQQSGLLDTRTTDNLSSYFPPTGMYQTEIPRVSTPTDLLAITNAKEIYSVDYYEGSKRVSAGLASYTQGEVYNHSKVICDRLNSSNLEDIRVVHLDGYQLIMATIKRENGETEYALYFSVRLMNASNELYSYWNIDQYPDGDYLNFQVWGCNMGQASSIAHYILTVLKEDKVLTNTSDQSQLPELFVKSGYYKEGKLFLTLINKKGVKKATLDGSFKKTESSLLELFKQELELNGSYQQEVTIACGSLFDVGLSLQAENANQIDAFYLADGPWGLDYLETEATINNFQISQQTDQPLSGAYAVERSVQLSGKVKGIVNLFRNILSGELVLPTKNYNAVAFKITNKLPVEVILVPDNLKNWEERPRLILPANNNEKAYVLNFSDFRDANANPIPFTALRSIVFSTMGSFSSFQDFDLAIKEMRFGEGTILGNIPQQAIQTKVFNYPNPFSENTTIQLPGSFKKVSVVVYDMQGRIVTEKNFTDVENQVQLAAAGFIKGVYLYRVTADENNYYGNFIIK